MRERQHDDTQSRTDRFNERSSRDRGEVERWDGEGGSQSASTPLAEDQQPVEQKRRRKQKSDRVT